MPKADSTLTRDGHKPSTFEGDEAASAMTRSHKDSSPTQSLSSEPPPETSIEQVFAELDAAGASEFVIQRDASPSPERNFFDVDFTNGI